MFAYLQNRSCQDGIRMVLDLVENSNKLGKPLFILQADLMHAFDTVAKPHIISLIKRLSLPSDLRSAITHLLDTPTAYIFVNGKNFSLKICNAALAQGDPISTILFCSGSNPP